MTRLLLNTMLALLVVAIAALVWAGQQKPPDPYLRMIMDSGTLRVGMDPTYPPFDTVQGGIVGGYDAGLAQAIAGDLGVKVAYKTLALDTLYDALLSGNVDMIISAQPLIPERQRDVRYSVPYYQSGQMLVVRPGEAGVTSVAGLRGKKVGVELGSNADTEARRLQRTTAAGMQLHSIYRTPQEALDALTLGKEDAAITDNLSVQTYLAAHPGSIAALAPPITDELYVIVMPVRADTLAALVNATIERLRASGELARLMKLANR